MKQVHHIRLGLLILSVVFHSAVGAIEITFSDKIKDSDFNGNSSRGCGTGVKQCLVIFHGAGGAGIEDFRRDIQVLTKTSSGGFPSTWGVISFHASGFDGHYSEKDITSDGAVISGIKSKFHQGNIHVVAVSDGVRAARHIANQGNFPVRMGAYFEVDPFSLRNMPESNSGSNFLSHTTYFYDRYSGQVQRIFNTGPVKKPTDNQYVIPLGSILQDFEPGKKQNYMDAHISTIVTARNMVHEALLPLAQGNHAGSLSTLDRQMDEVSLPSYWTEYSLSKQVGQTLTEARMIAGLAPKNTKRVVVFGNSTAAQLTYQEAISRWGNSNVKLVLETPPTKVQRQLVATEFQADVILGVRSDGANPFGNKPMKKNSGSSLDQADYVKSEIFSKQNTGKAAGGTQVKALTSALEQTATILKVAADSLVVADPDRFTTQKSHVKDLYGEVKDMYGFYVAISKDIERSDGGKYTTLSSHTIEEAYRFGFSKIVEHAAKTKTGTGQLFRRIGIGSATFGLEDWAETIGQHAGSGSMDIDTVTKYLDAANKSAWTVLGAAISRGDPKTTKLFQDIGGLLPSIGREMSKSTIKGLFRRFSKADEKMLSQYDFVQQLRRSQNLEAQSVEEYFDHDEKVLSVIGRQGIIDMNTKYSKQTVIRKEMHSERYQVSCVAGNCNRTAIVPRHGDEAGGVIFQSNSHEVDEPNPDAERENQRVIEAIDADSNKIFTRYE